MTEISGVPVYLIGGTTEANLAARRLTEAGFAVTVSVATSLGARPAAVASGREAEAGPKQAAEICQRAAELGAAAIIDCSHPFAHLVSTEASNAAQKSGLPYFRFCRSPFEVSGDLVTSVGSWAEAVTYLQGRPGRALLTVGTRNLEPFMNAGIDFIARILPVAASLAECVRLDIGPERIIAAHPPFSAGFNRACIRHAGASVLVTKESGLEGGLPEKAEAAALEGIELLVVARPPEPEAIHDLEQLVASLRKAVS